MEVEVAAQHTASQMQHIDDDEDTNEIGHYSLVLALYKCFKCDQMESSLRLNTDLRSVHNDDESMNWSDHGDDGDCPDRTRPATSLPPSSSRSPAHAGHAKDEQDRPLRRAPRAVANALRCGSICSV